MFWRKQKAAIERFHPLHRTLTLEQGFTASLRRDDWDPVVQSLAHHTAEVRRGKWQLSDRVPGVVVPMLRVVASDMTPYGVLSVAVDMRGPKVPEKNGQQYEIPVQRPLLWARQWFAFDPWLRMRAELRDGSVLDLTVTDRVRFRKVKKRTPRGKIKYKTKQKTVQIVQVNRRFAKDAAIRQPSAPPPRWIRVKARQGRRVLIRTSAKFPGPVLPGELVDRILLVATEPFRWTPPGSDVRSTK